MTYSNKSKSSGNCGCSDEHARHILVMTNAELMDRSGIDFLAADGVHLRLTLQTFMQDERQSYWNYRLTLLESRGGTHVRRVHGHFSFVSNPLVLSPTRISHTLRAEHPAIMQPFVCDSIDVAINPTITRGKSTDQERSLRELVSSANMTTSGYQGASFTSAVTNVVGLPFTNDVIPLSWWVERRCVSGVRHSRFCVNLPYLYCQSRICSQGEDGTVSCGEWEYETDSCDPITCN